MCSSKTSFMYLVQQCWKFLLPGHPRRSGLGLGDLFSDVGSPSRRSEIAINYLIKLSFCVQQGYPFFARPQDYADYNEFPTLMFRARPVHVYIGHLYTDLIHVEIITLLSGNA